MAKPKINLVGLECCYAELFNKCEEAAKKAGWEWDDIDDFLNEVKSGIFNYSLKIVRKYFDVLE